jgi:hypothetical protein
MSDQLWFSIKITNTVLIGAAVIPPSPPLPPLLLPLVEPGLDPLLLPLLEPEPEPLPLPLPPLLPPLPPPSSPVVGTPVFELSDPPHATSATPIVSARRAVAEQSRIVFPRVRMGL